MKQLRLCAHFAVPFVVLRYFGAVAGSLTFLLSAALIKRFPFPKEQEQE